MRTYEPEMIEVPCSPPFPGGINDVDDHYPPGSGKLTGPRWARMSQSKDRPPKGVVILKKSEFKKLYEYSLSLPTDPQIGFKWKRWQRGCGWLYAEVVACEDKPGYQRIRWAQIKFVSDDKIPVRRRGIQVRHVKGLLDVEYVGDSVLILAGEHAGEEATLMGPDGEGWRVLLENNQEAQVGPDDLEALIDGAGA